MFVISVIPTCTRERPGVLESNDNTSDRKLRVMTMQSIYLDI